MKWIKTRLPALRWICALLVSVSVATLSACGDAPTKPLVGPVETPAAKERLSGVARAIASAMNSADVRLDVLKAMRASPRVGHSLILAEYLCRPAGGEAPRWQRGRLELDRRAIPGNHSGSS